MFKNKLWCIGLALTFILPGFAKKGITHKSKTPYTTFQKNKTTKYRNSTNNAMKHIIYTINFLLLFCCCSKKDTTLETIEPESISYSAYIGETCNLFIDLKANKYTVRNNNPGIASWSYIEKSDAISIKLEADGEGTIDILDANNNIKNIIHIYAFYFNADKIEESDMHPTEKAEVTVEVIDSDVKSLIEKQLWKEIEQKRGTFYSFKSDTKVFTMSYPQTTEKLQGTYKWSIDSLTLNYQNTIEKYGFKIATGRRCYLISSDKTKEYQLLFPNAGIKVVRTQTIWYDHTTNPLPGLVL